MTHVMRLRQLNKNIILNDKINKNIDLKKNKEETKKNHSALKKLRSTCQTHNPFHENEITQ